MVDRITLEIDLTPEEHQKIEILARQQGYDTPVDYVRALIGSDALAHDQAYFWTKEWQAGELEADEDIAAGRVAAFDTMEDLIADLMDYE